MSYLKNPNEFFFMAKGVSVNFGGLKALEDFTVTVNKKEICGLIGPNGAGKTTFLNVISGFIVPTNGEMHLDGTNLFKFSPYQRANLGIVRTFQGGRLLLDRDVLENVIVGTHSFINMNFLKGGLKLWRSNEKDAYLRSLELIEIMGLKDLVDKKVGELPFGQQRLVEFARALIREPKFLLLDEPGAGLTSIERRHFCAVLEKLCEEEEVSILITEHIMEVIMNVSHRIVVMASGKKVAEGKPEEIRANPEVQDVYLGGKENA